MWSFEILRDQDNMLFIFSNWSCGFRFLFGILDKDKFTQSVTVEFTPPK